MLMPFPNSGSSREGMSTEELMKSPARYYNRELSWLQFNQRVLEEAGNKDHPLLERLRFVSISASNLDEFYMVRVAGLEQQVRKRDEVVSTDGLTPQQQLHEIHKFAADLMGQKLRHWQKIRQEMQEAGIVIVEADDITEEEREWLEKRFYDEAFPILAPIRINPAKKLEFVQNRGLMLGLSMVNAAGDTQNGIVEIPPILDRFVRLQPSKEKDDGQIRFAGIETIVTLFLDELFPGYRVRQQGMFRVLRDSDIEFEEEAEDLTRRSLELRSRRRHGNVVRLEIDSRMPAELQKFVMQTFAVAKEAVFIKDGLVGLADVSKLIVSDRPDLLFQKFEPRFPERIQQFDNDVFAAIRSKDFVVHHPYESFAAVLQYLEQAARDPDVIAIKWTLYRTLHERSPIIEALKEAAEQGKFVTTVIELKARFDEHNNIKLAAELEQVGVNVIFGIHELKTHAKLGVVVRREPRGVATYCHIGTGNYHPITARIYTDLSFFTDDPIIARDVVRIFNFVTGNGEEAKLEKLAASPNGIREKIMGHIDDEIAHARAGRPASIWMKMNSLVDPGIIDALYLASQAGVQIDLVVRGICCLRPGVAGLSENIRVKSIIGRFLEHSRIYCFGCGHPLPSREAAVYISSADLMQRNLDRRVEALTPINNETVHEQILDQIMGANLMDNEQSWRILADGSAERIVPESGKEPFSAHEYFMRYPSLSGRGHAKEESMPPKFSAVRGS